MKIKCDEEFYFSEDGLRVKKFKAGEHEVTELCGNFAIQHHGAKDLADETKPEPGEKGETDTTPMPDEDKPEPDKTPKKNGK